jgi:hypothetical protein
MTPIAMSDRPDDTVLPPLWITALFGVSMVWSAAKLYEGVIMGDSFPFVSLLALVLTSITVVISSCALSPNVCVDVAHMKCTLEITQYNGTVSSSEVSKRCTAAASQCGTQRCSDMTNVLDENPQFVNRDKDTKNVLFYAVDMLNVALMTAELKVSAFVPLRSIQIG